MKRYSVVFRETAKADLRSIYEYVLDQSKNKQIALAYIKRIRDKCGKIGDVPLGGVARSDLGASLRMVVFERSIVILYLVEGERVRITNIFSGSRDYETLLSDR
ncbi:MULTISPECIES: type II toxin-antitoxin system RelE/ParE family toxin [Rhizobium]|uniref:Toxin ParE1/3/4 n=1 Tax=Rhizobium paranaense TaxID=1650438 RepID=A0A7W9CZL6_9HYPH|nr:MULTISPECIES: type II toxin-antitoxin system RelE/ParE family toxin [Rhizobium]MBB5571866.1 toxin ParE1/3/4 [Rhizobium paranaense]PST63926.1 type II toxin-antitoxin system RelE/ParE family toxin [Rhizobium sp. SEMIA4064]